MRRVRLLAVAAALAVSTIVAVPFVTIAGATIALDPGDKGCDVLLVAPVSHDCLLPWPNNAFTVASKKTPTGRRLTVSSTLDPTNVKGVHVSTTYINQGDGFSPGPVIMTYIPNLDTGYYPTGVKTTDAELATVPLRRHDWHPEWNYSIEPHPPPRQYN